MNAKDIIRRRVSLVLELQRYKKALKKIVSMKNDRDTEEQTARELGDAIAVAEHALRKVRP